MLNEQNRQKLDGIVQQMTANNESPENIQFVVNDFKTKYSDVSQETPELPEKKSVGGFIGNLGKSALDFGKGLVNVVAHPVDTVSALGNLAIGGADLLGSTIGLSDGQGKGADMARGLGQMYKERYGGIDNIGNTLYKDPVGVLADLATFASGGAGAVGKLGKVSEIGGLTRTASTLGKTANTLSKVAKVTDPLNAVLGSSKLASKVSNPTLKYLAENGASTIVKAPLKGGSTLAKGALGVSSGIGKSGIETIYEAGKAGKTGAQEAMRGLVSQEDILSKARTAENALGKLKKAEWDKLGLDKIGDTLDISPIYKELDSGLKDLKVNVLDDGSLDFSRARGSIRFDKNAQGKVQDIFDSMQGYGLKKGDRLPSAVDDLKQSFASKFDDNSEVKGFVERMRKTTRDTLSQVKGYDDYAKNYGEIQELIKTFQTELSSKNKNVNTTWRKLINSYSGKNNVGRQNILKILNDSGLSDIGDNIAGFTAKDFIPESAISRIGAGGVGVSAFTNPVGLLSLPAFSPRAVGEITNYLGKTSGKVKKLSDKAKTASESNKALKTLKYLGGQVYDRNKTTRSATLIERMREQKDQSQ